MPELSSTWKDNHDIFYDSFRCRRCGLWFPKMKANKSEELCPLCIGTCHVNYKACPVCGIIISFNASACQKHYILERRVNEY